MCSLTGKVGGRASDLAASGHSRGTLVRVSYGARRRRGCDSAVDEELVPCRRGLGSAEGKAVCRFPGGLWPTRRCLVRRRGTPIRRRGSPPGGWLLFLGWRRRWGGRGGLRRR